MTLIVTICQNLSLQRFQCVHPVQPGPMINWTWTWSVLPYITGCWLLHLNPFPAKRSRVTQLVQHIMHRPMGPWLLCRSGVPSKVPAGLGGLPDVVMMKCILWHLRAWLLISTVQWTSQDSKLNRACDKYLTTIKHSFYMKSYEIYIIRNFGTLLCCWGSIQ